MNRFSSEIQRSRTVAVREWRDRRILAAFRFVDAITGGPVRQALALNLLREPIPAEIGDLFERSRLGQPLGQFVLNPSGYYVLLSAPGFETYRETFSLDELAAPPANTPFNLAVSDPSGQYLPRLYGFSLPRNPASDSASVASANSLFQPARIPLFPSPAAPTNPGWAVLRATVVNAATNRRLPWALIVATVAGVPTLTQADWRGEALIAVPGIPVTTWGSGEGNGEEPPPVTVTEVPATLEVVFDPVVISLEEGGDFTEISDPNARYRPDPERLNNNRSGLLAGSVTVNLASGRDRAYRLAVTLAPIP